MQRWRRKFGILRKSPEGVAVSGRRRLSSVARPDQAVPPDWVGQWVRGLLLEQAPRAVSACCLLALKLVFLMTILKIIQPLPVLILLIRACGDYQVNLSKQATCISTYCIQGTEQALFKGLEHVKGGLEALRERTSINQQVRGKMLYFPGGALVKNPPPNAGDEGDSVSIPGLGRSLGEGNGNPLQYSCLENSMDRGAWQATVQGITKSQTQLSEHTHTHTHTGCSWRNQPASCLYNKWTPPPPPITALTFWESHLPGGT